MVLIMEQPLNKIRTLDFTRVLAGPMATQILGDLGAEVIKVESPGGDETRAWPPMFSKDESGYFCFLNRNKKAITLNLKNKKGKKIAVELAKKADVVVENFAPGVAKRLGIDYETLKQIKPDLIYCSISGFGQYGPYRDKKAYDPIIQGMTGLMSITGEKDRPPAKVGIPVTDLVAALHSVIAIQSALLYRKETGKGQYIDIALYDSMISMLTIMAAEYFATDTAPGRFGFDHAHRIPARAFEAKDGKYVQVAATSDVMYPKFCNAVDLPELINDERFNTNLKRVENRKIITPILEKKMRTKNSNEWLRLFEKATLPAGLILNLEEVFQDKHLATRDMVLETEHPNVGIIKLLGFPYKFSLTNPKIKYRPPLLGEHNEEVLSQLLNYTKSEIEILRKEQVI